MMRHGRGTLVLPAALLTALVFGAGLASDAFAGSDSRWARKWASKTGTIIGTVNVEGIGAAAGVRVVLDRRIAVLTDDDGNFAFHMVPPGRHRLSAQYLSYLYQGSTTAKVKAGTTWEAAVDLQLNPSVGETVGVLTEEDFPVESLTIGEVTAHRRIAVLCDLNNGFWTVDVSEPSAPFLLARGGDGRNCSDMALDWPYLYLGLRSSDRGIAIYDLEDPSAPFLVAELYDRRHDRVALRGDTLFAVGTDFHVYNVSDPSSPFLISELPIRGWGVAAQGDYVFLNTDDHVLEVVDVSDLADPRVIWSSTETASGGRDCIVDGSFVYALNWDRMHVYEISDPRDPLLVSVIDYEYLQSQGADLPYALSLNGVDVESRIAYISATSNGALALDYSDVFRPLFSWKSDSLVAYAMNLSVSGHYLYIAGRDTGFRIVKRR